MIYVLTVSLLILTLLTITVLIKLKGNSPMFWVLIPILVFNVGFTWIVMSDLKGWPHQAMPPNDSVFYSSILSKPDIYLVAKPKDAKEPRFYAIPFTEENVKEIEKASKMTKRGQRVVIKQQKDNKFKTKALDHTAVNKKGLQD